jgi:hypothetical protein
MHKSVYAKNSLSCCLDNYIITSCTSSSSSSSSSHMNVWPLDFLYIPRGLGRSKSMKIVWQLLLWAVCKMFEHLLLQYGIYLGLNSVGHIQMGIVFRQNFSIIEFLGSVLLFLLFWSAWQEQFAFIVLLCDLKSLSSCVKRFTTYYAIFKLHCKSVCISCSPVTNVLFFTSVSHCVYQVRFAAVLSTLLQQYCKQISVVHVSYTGTLVHF